MQNDNYRMMAAMVLFRLEQSLGAFVVAKSPQVDAAITPLADEISARQASARARPPILNTADLIADTYLEDLFQLALKVSAGSSDNAIVRELKDLCATLALYEIRNAVAHPNRPFPPCFWFRMAAIASDPTLQKLDMPEVTASLESALQGRLESPPEEWLRAPTWAVPNNLPAKNDFDITGLIGRPSESKDLARFLQNPRMPCVAVVAPGGVGKTALGIDVLQKVCDSPSSRAHFEAVIFLSLKNEKLTAGGLEKLDAPNTIADLERNLCEAIPDVLGGEEHAESFDELKSTFGNRKLLLFIDNLETLLRDAPESFDAFQVDLPPHWRLLVTSRVTVNSATCLPLSPLNDGNAKHLARLYATRKNVKELVAENLVNRVVERSRCNPLAIRLSVDAFALGSPLEESLNNAAKDVLSFSYRNLLEVISEHSVAVVEALFLTDPQTRIELADNIGTSIDAVASGLHELTRTSLVTRDSGRSNETYSLYPALRDLLLVSPRDAKLRQKIQHRILARRTAIAGDDTRQLKLSPFHPDYVSSDLPPVVRNVLFETNRTLKRLAAPASRQDALDLLVRLRELKLESPETCEISRHIAKIYSRLGDPNSAINELTEALKRSTQDLQSLIMLGRLYHDGGQYKEALACYTTVRDQIGWRPDDTDLQTARYCASGFLLAILYLNDYDALLRETQDWDSYGELKVDIGAFRARAWKRKAESLTSLADKTNALNKGINILGQVAKEFGYPERVSGVFNEIIREIIALSDSEGLKDCKEAQRLLEFVETHIDAVYGSSKGGVGDIVTAIGKLAQVPLRGNPFHNAEWRDFLHVQGGQAFVDEGYRAELVNEGFTPVTIYHIPRHASPYIFGRDDAGNQVFIHFSSVRDTPWPNWVAVKEGAILAVKAKEPEQEGKVARATEAVVLTASS
ncbi:NB-ARC domain-containing protein [Paraburkholderia sp.]|uniref:NB-ARC domain-containing protein n=1 Tax=Paraburkholderia sp. TaxID=1926495 RepID=UPI003C7D2148